MNTQGQRVAPYVQHILMTTSSSSCFPGLHDDDTRLYVKHMEGSVHNLYRIFRMSMNRLERVIDP